MELKKWKKDAILVQDLHSTALNNRLYDRFQFGEFYELKQKILGILFGPVPEEGRDISSWHSLESLYKKEQIKKCYNIIDLIKQNTFGGKSYDFAYIIVCVFCENRPMIVPVFRVRSNYRQESRDLANNVFIDHHGRVYKNWGAYLEENTWDLSWLCVPVNGYYSTCYNYQFIDQSDRGRVVNALNNISAVTGIASALTALGGAAMTLFPPTAPLGLTVLTSSMVAGIPSGVYGMGSGIHRLVDRSAHQQSISLSDAESRMCWLNISSGALAFASAGVTKGIAVAAGAGKAIPQSVRVIGNTLTISSLGLAGTGVAVNIYDVSKKGWSNITAFDFLQISTSVLIFTHSAVTTKLANSIINEAQTSKLNSIKQNLGKRDQIKIDRQVESLVSKHGTSTGKQQMILELTKVDNVPAFLSKWRTVAGNIKPAGFRMNSSPANAPALVPSGRGIQLASSSNVLVGNVPVAQLNSTQTFRLNSILFKLSELATKVFLELISKIRIRSMNHMNKLMEKFVKYIEQKIAECRIANPNPDIRSEPSVQSHYERQILQSVTRNETPERIFSNETIFPRETEENAPSEETDEIIQGFIPEMNVFSEETYSKFVDEIVNNEENLKEWKQTNNFLSCTCTLTRTGETRTIEFFHDESQDTTFATVKPTGEIKIYQVDLSNVQLSTTA